MGILFPGSENIDWHEGLRTLAEVLAEMHGEQMCHGRIDLAYVRERIAGDGRTLDREKIRESALTSGETASFHADVVQFGKLAINIIQGPSAEQDTPFCATFYSGKGYPAAFLNLLESTQKAESATEITMSAILKTLLPSETVQSPPASGKEELPKKAETLSGLPRAVGSGVVSLPNGTVGRPYSIPCRQIVEAIAKIRGEDPGLARISHFQLPEGCGLTFDYQSGAIHGTPLATFDGTLELDYVPHEHHPSIRYSARLFINPDPLSLWKDLPTPADAPYQKPSTAQEALEFPGFRVVAASRRGRAHANRGEFRDDDYAIAYSDQAGWLIVAVADGAGSAKYARRGSQLACETTSNRLRLALDNPEFNVVDAAYEQYRDWNHPEVAKALRRLLHEAALKAYYRLVEEATRPAEESAGPLELRNFDTTLILAALKKVSDGWVLGTFSIGDGGAGILMSDDEGMAITQPEGGEHAGQTTFLTMPSSLRDDEETLERHFRFLTTPGLRALMVMTDGVSDPKFPCDEAFQGGQYWSALWSEVKEVTHSPEALLEWLNFFSPGNHDDRTLVVVVPEDSSC